LTKALEKVVNNTDVPASEELITTACFFHFSLGERGWPKRIEGLVRDHGNIWIIRNFFLHLLIFSYVEDDVTQEDSDDLLNLCVMIIE